MGDQYNEPNGTGCAPRIGRARNTLSDEMPSVTALPATEVIGRAVLLRETLHSADTRRSGGTSRRAR
jgi:hypothetical protein